MPLITDGGSCPKYAGGPSADVTLSMSYADQPAVLRGERTLASVSSVVISGPDSALTLASSVAVAHPKARARFTGGTAGKEYMTTWYGVLDNGDPCVVTASIIVQSPTA